MFKSFLLSVIPPARWGEALDLIQADLDTIANQFVGALHFGRYLRTQWLPLAHVVSAGTCARANSICEAWNRWALKCLGGIHPQIYDFFGN